MTTADKPEIDNQIERIRTAYAAAFGMTEVDISKNPRRLLKVGLWELTAARPAEGLRDLFVQMQGEGLAMVGLSFSVPIQGEGMSNTSAGETDGRQIKFSFTSDPEDPMAPIDGGKVSGSVLYKRPDGIWISMSADISGYSMTDMAGKGMDAFLGALDSSRQSVAYEPGVLDGRDPSPEEKALVLDLSRTCFARAETGLRSFMDRFQSL